jgi:VWFA-related protein
MLMRLLLMPLILTLVPVSSAQTNSSTPPEPAATIRVSSQMVLLDALVEENKTGRPLETLNQADFHLYEDGIPQTITYFSQDRLPLSVIFLFDLTDTVRSALKPLAAGAREVLDHLKPEDEVAIMAFSSHTEMLQVFTRNRAQAAEAINRASGFETGDGTFIHECMYEAVQQALQARTPGSRRVLVWLTDGTANTENSQTQKTIGKHGPAHLHSQEEATSALLRSGVVVSALIDKTAATEMSILANNVNPFGMMNGARTGDVRNYADMTGGPVLETSKKEVADRLAELIDQIRLRYTLGYKPSAAKPEGTFCKLRVELDPAIVKLHPDLKKAKVRTRQGYYR